MNRERREMLRDRYQRMTPEQRQRMRKRVLAVTLQDLQRVAASYLRPEQASIAVITNPGAEGVCRDLGLDVIHL